MTVGLTEAQNEAERLLRLLERTDTELIAAAGQYRAAVHVNDVDPNPRTAALRQDALTALHVAAMGAGQ